MAKIKGISIGDTRANFTPHSGRHKAGDRGVGGKKTAKTSVALCVCVCVARTLPDRPMPRRCLGTLP